MRSTHLVLLLKILLLLSSISILYSCVSRPVILTQSYKKRVQAPVKRVPSSAKVPGTQRPYKIKGKTYYPIPSSEGYREAGIASWYGHPFHGRKTSNGETYNMHSMTAAHKTLPMNTHLLVKNVSNGKEIVVRINDRGPFVKGRIIDLSQVGAKKLGIVKHGTAKVRITALGEAVSYQQGKEKGKRFLPHQDFNTGEFYIQIGSFSKAENAERLARKVTGWGSKVVLQPFNRSGTKFFRVQVKAGNSLEQAKREERIFVEAGFPDAFVVAR